jgi:hypothetical protein
MVGISLALMPGNPIFGHQLSVSISQLSVLDDDAAAGDVVGTLSVSGGIGTYTYTLIDDAGGCFALNPSINNQLDVAAALSAGVAEITLQADNGVDPAIQTSLVIAVLSAGGWDDSFWWMF